MLERLGIEHLFALSGTEALLGFLTPLALFVVFFLAQVILPGRRVPGYVTDPATGEPRAYKLSGLLVFALALVVWALELTGMPRDWFYRSAPYAVAGGTVVATTLALIAVFSQPRGEVKNPIAAFWLGRAQELSFFNNRFDVKMYLYVAGGRDAHTNVGFHRVVPYEGVLQYYRHRTSVAARIAFTEAMTINRNIPPISQIEASD